MGESEQPSIPQEAVIEIDEITGVLWRDDNGTLYRRTIEGGDLVDTEVPE